MPSGQVVNMSEITKIGPDRCAMVKPEPGVPRHKWLGRFAQGSERIRILLAGGWVIVEDDRNHLRNDYGQGSKENGVSKRCEGEPFEAKTDEEPQKVAVQEKRRPGRPRKLK